MAARAIWKGVIRFGAAKLPVKLYAAVEAKGVHFRLLHSRDKAPVRQQMVHPGTGEIVPRSEVRKGYPVGRSEFVILDDADLQKAEPESSRDIEITRFVDPDEIDHRWYERPYYLGPDGNRGAYFALARALDRKGREGVATWVMRGKSYVGSLRTHDGYLMLIALRHADEVVSIEDLKTPEGRPLEKRELEMARRLVASLEGVFDPEKFPDEYRQRVLELVETKAKGGRVKVKKFRPKKTDDSSLADALAASLRGEGKRRASGG